MFNDGTTTQVYQATDGTGNTSTCSFSVVVFPIPDILFNGSADDHNGLGVGFIAITAVGGGGGYTYAWNRNGQFFSTDEDLSGLNAGSYTLTVTDQNGCTSALAPIVINNTVGTGEPGQTGAVRLWPNPTYGMFELEIIDLDVSLAVILNAQGRLVKNLPAENLRNTIDVNDLSTGVYFLKLCTSKGRVITLPFVKSD